MMNRAPHQVPVSVMVFSLDEEINLPACLKSLEWCDDVIVVDSYSKDRTCEIANAHGARVFQHPFEGFGTQRNWALENTQPRHDWILILDADERVPSETASAIAARLRSVPPETVAFRLARRFYFWGHWLRYSSLYPTYVVRLVRRGRVRYVNRGHAETQEIDGLLQTLGGDLIDENLKGIGEWFERQNRYSSREAEYELEQEGQCLRIGDLVNGDPLVRRAVLKRTAARLPVRPLWYFFYSYLLRGGFLDGRDGLVYCLMKSVYQGMIVIKKHEARMLHKERFARSHE